MHYVNVLNKNFGIRTLYMNFMEKIYVLKIHIDIDDQATIYNANNEAINQRSKHINIKYHKVKN